MQPSPALPVLYAGFGCRRGCPADTLEALLRQALSTLELPLSAVAGIASIALKADEAGLHELTERLARPLHLFTPIQLQPFEPLLSHRSATAFAHSGCWGVAESTALALACQAQGTARLLIPRLTFGPATLALACSR